MSSLAILSLTRFFLWAGRPRCAGADFPVAVTGVRRHAARRPQGRRRLHGAAGVFGPRLFSVPARPNSRAVSSRGCSSDLAAVGWKFSLPSCALVMLPVSPIVSSLLFLWLCRSLARSLLSSLCAQPLDPKYPVARIKFLLGQVSTTTI